MSKRLLSAAAVGLLCATVASATALGDGGPGPGVMQGWDGIAHGKIRYVAVPTGTGETVLQSVSRRSGRVIRFTTVKGNYGIPLVAFDGTTGGLSRDGRTLVLWDASVGAQLRKTTSFAVVNLRRFQVRAVVSLRGDFSFDALSPGARMLYLVEHVPGQDLTRYRVRAYDLGGRRLLGNVVVDKSESESVMQGYPIARASTTDDRWVYTLYGGSKHPFIHALDTQSVSAVCVDLPRSWQQLDLYGLRLRLQPDGRLVVRHRSGGKPLATVDMKNFRVVSAVRNP